MRPLVIIGCGGFGREVAAIVETINAVSPSWQLMGFVDDDPSERNVELVRGAGSQILGTTDWLVDAPEEVAYLIGIGSGHVRRSIDQHPALLRRESAVLVHPAATVGRQVALGPGTIVCAGARITANITIGRHSQVHVNASVAHDCALGDYCTVSPLAAVSGAVRLGNDVMVGAAACLLPGCRVGDRSTIGAGAVVTRDVPSQTIVKGVPAS